MSDYNEEKKAKISEIEFSKAKAIVDIAMKDSSFACYKITPPSEYQPFHTLYSNKEFAAELSVKLKQSLTLFVGIEKIEGDIEKHIKKISELCKKIALSYNAALKEKDEMSAREACNNILLPSPFAIWYDLFYEREPMREQRPNYDDFFHIGGSSYISKRLVSQKEFLDVIGQNFSTFPRLSDPVDRIDFVSVLQYCNALSHLEGREPFYALNGESDEAKWQEMIMDASGSAFYCNESANGFRLPRQIELKYIKERSSKISEYLGEFEGDIFSPNCAFATGLKQRELDFSSEIGEEGICFRLAYFD